MPFQQKLRVTFTHLRIYSNRRLLAKTSKLTFKMTVGGAVLDLTAAPIRVTVPSMLAFPTLCEATASFEVAPDQHLDIKAEAWDVHKDGKKDALGEATFRIWQPDLTHAVEGGTLKLVRMDGAKRVGHVDVEFKVEYLSDRGAWGKMAAGAVFACRTGAKGVSYTAVGGGEAVRVEVCPVTPAIDDAAMAARKRPVPIGAPWRLSPTDGRITHDAPINVIGNPSVIPIIPALRVGRSTAARVEVTYYHPASLAFTESDARLEWTATSTDGGDVRFFDGAPYREKGYGRSVLVYGVAEGEVTLEVRYVVPGSSRLVATFRALVRNVGRIRFRANILFARGDFRGDGTEARIPSSLPAHVAKHVAVANRILRQAAVELVADADATPGDGAVATAHAGVFEVDVSDRIGLTRNLTADVAATTALNARAGVLNIVYVHTPASGATLGLATDFPASGHGSATITDSGSPSHSWCLPTGVPPDAPAGTREMGIHHGRYGREGARAFLLFDTSAWHLEATARLNPVDLLRREYLAAHAVLAEIDNFRDFGLMLFSEWTEADWDAARARLEREGDAPSATARFVRGDPDFETFLITLDRARERPHANDHGWDPNSPWTEAEWRAAREGLAPPGVSGSDGVVGALCFGSTMAHELGHVLNLRHRLEPGDDGVPFPDTKQNLMSYGGANLSHDIDILQAKVIHLSPLVERP